MATAPGPARLFDLVALQLDALATGLAITPDDAAAIRSFLGDLRARSADPSLWRRPRWSAVTDDQSPFEWSVVTRHGPPDLRLLFEAAGEPPSSGAYWRAGCDLTSWLAGRLGADPAPFERLADLFAPDGTSPFFVQWHGIEWRPGRRDPPRVKLYLNPSARGSEPAADVTRQAMERMGFGAAWPHLRGRLGDSDDATGGSGLQLSHVAVDLESGDDARLKIYVRSRSVAALAGLYGPVDDVIPTIETVLGGPAPTTLPRPGFVVLHHTARSPSAPARTVLNLHVPSLCATDRLAHDGIVRLLGRHHLDPTTYRRAVDGLARARYFGTNPYRPAGDDPLAGQVGLHSYVSFQREPGGARITTYFAPRAYAARFGWGAVDPTDPWGDA